eukprot:1182506-Amphidinium_carterae.1
MSLVVAQRRDDEVEVVGEDVVSEGYRKYKLLYGDFPDAECDPTVEQISAVDALVKAIHVPYVDFAVWAPHGNILLHKMQLAGLTWNASCELQPVDSRDHHVLTAGTMWLATQPPHEAKRRPLDEERAKATQAGQLHEFDPAATWEIVWSAACLDAQWWHKHLEIPAMLLMTKTGAAGSGLQVTSGQVLPD